MSSIDERAREPVNALLSATDETVLEVGMVLALETRVREAGTYGMHLEDLVETQPSGSIVHTQDYPYDRLMTALG